MKTKYEHKRGSGRLVLHGGPSLSTMAADSYETPGRYGLVRARVYVSHDCKVVGVRRLLRARSAGGCVVGGSLAGGAR